MARAPKSVAKELGAALLGDVRRSARLEQVAQALVRRPGASLPRAMGNVAALEAAYRLLGNEEVRPKAILAPHVAATAERVTQAGGAYCIHDTTELRFGGADREGLGPLQNGGRGFLAHVSLAVATDGSRLPLGILGADTIVRPEEPKRRRGTRKSRNAADSESLKWSRGVLAAEEAIAEGARLIHLMDREADIYALLALLTTLGARFVVRVAQNRVAEDEDGVGRLFDLLETSAEFVTREVPLSRRVRGSKQHPRRSERRATLTLSTKVITLHRPRNASAKALPATLTLNFVRVLEQNPPDGEQAVDWKIVTNEPCTTLAEIEAVVDAYRTRWVIEEFNKAMKTGCGIEECQLERVDSILNLFAIVLPVAVQLLALRSLAAARKNALAAGVLTPAQLYVLRAMSKQVRLPSQPTAEQALLAIAALGGHLKNNGPPGWIVLGRGFQDLLRYVEAWEVLQNMGKK